jgi:PKD repeat protein
MPGAIRRFSYTGSVNAPPTARASATPSSGGAPLDVAFSSSGSTDPDGDTLTYDWNFGDGSTHSAEPNPSHTYSSDGSYTARLTVADGNGHTAEETVAVRVGNTAPTPSISAPVDESTYRGGVEVQLRGSATDSEDGAVPESGLSWQVLLHHNTHIHEQSTGSGSQASFTPLVDHDADSYYEVRLTATDSEGLQKSGTVQVRPETRKLTLASSPAGAPIGYAGQQDVTAPFTRESAVGFRTSVSAAESFTKDRLTYRFQGWSDGGAQQHTIEVPATDSTLTASYARERKKPRAPRPR